MGFEFDGTAILDFTGTRYQGVEVVVYSDVTVEEYQGFVEAGTLVDEWEWFQKHVLVSWNLERKGQPIPIDSPLSNLSGPFIRKVIRGWQTAFVEIDAPLAPPSASP